MEKIRVFIDPGHGGTDRANRGPTGYVEADGVLDISLRLKRFLENNGGFVVGMSREQDKTVGVSERGRMAANWGADLFISNHTNATGQANSTARGVVTFYSVKRSGDQVIAKDFSSSIAAAMGTQDRGAAVRESTNYPGNDYYGVINASVGGGVKHVFLIESGYHDNQYDEALLKDPNVREKIAKAQYEVIKRMFGIKEDKKLDWKQAIVKEALDLNLITSEEWIDNAEDPAPIWYVCAMAINTLKESKNQ